jgi:hypothetical protein
MARATRYDWPDDQTLQALLDEQGTVETARQIGCPPSSLSNRIRRRGLRGPKPRPKADVATANGKADATNPNGKADAPNPSGLDRGQANGTPDAAKVNGKPDPTNAKQEGDTKEPSVASVGEKPKPSEGPVRTRVQKPLEYLGSAYYGVRQ